MSTRNLAWGVTGGVSVLLALACGETTKIHDVGDVDEGGKGASGGGGGVGGRTAPSKGGSGGVGVAGFSSGGLENNCVGFAGSGGTGGIGVAGSVSSAGTPSGCFDPPNEFTPDFGPAAAPQNTVFAPVHSVAGDTVKNYADQVVLGSGSIWEAYANFPASTAATNAAILLPDQLSQVGASFGQFYVGVGHHNCDGMPAAGHKLSVELWWKQNGAVAAFPTHGVALGAVSDKGEAVWFDDSAKSYVIGDAQTKLLMNTLNKLVVEHSFAEDDNTDAGKVTLGVWLLPDAEFPTTFYLGNVTWD